MPSSPPTTTTDACGHSTPASSPSKPRRLSPPQCSPKPGEAGPRQASLARFLALCTTEPLTDEQAKAVGTLAARAGHDDIVDVTVVEGAIRRRDSIVTSNPTHIRKIADATRTRLTIETV